MVLWCTFRFICNCMIQDIQECHFSEHSSTYQLQQEAPHNNISFNATEDIWHDALDKRTCTSCVYMLNDVYFLPEINIVQQGGKKRCSSMFINQVSGSCRGHNEMNIYNSNSINQSSNTYYMVSITHQASRARSKRNSTTFKHVLTNSSTSGVRLIYFL